MNKRKLLQGYPIGHDGKSSVVRQVLVMLLQVKIMIGALEKALGREVVFNQYKKY